MKPSTVVRRLSTMAAGLAVAFAAAGATLVVALSIVVATHAPGIVRLLTVLSLSSASAWSEHPDRLLASLSKSAAETLSVICCAPVICTALIGEVAQLRRPLGFAILSAAFTMVLPVAAGGVLALAGLSSPYLLVPLLATGGAAGLCYGAVAAPAGPAPPNPVGHIPDAHATAEPPKPQSFP